MGSLGNSLSPTNSESPIGAFMEPVQKATDPLSWATGGKWADIASNKIPGAANAALAPITQEFGDIDRTINPVRRYIPIVDQIGNVAEAKPADAIGLAVGSFFSAGALDGALASAGGAGAAGSGTAGIAGAGSADLGAGVAGAGSADIGTAGGLLGSGGTGVGGTLAPVFTSGVSEGTAGIAPAALTPGGLGLTDAGSGQLGMSGFQTFASNLGKYAKVAKAGTAASGLAGGQGQAPAAPTAARGGAGGGRAGSNSIVPSPLPMMGNSPTSIIAMPTMGQQQLPTSSSSYENLLTSMLGASQQNPMQGLSGSSMPGGGSVMLPNQLIPGRY